MKSLTFWGFVLLAIYLILVGLTSLVGGLSIPSVMFGFLALVSGILILIGSLKREM